MPRSRKRLSLPLEPVAAAIDALAHDGRGIAHREGKAVFIHGALPGEAVAFKYTARHSGYDEGEVDKIITPSPARVEPRCPHFSVCGGCRLQYLEAAEQISFKQDWLLANLKRIGGVEPQQLLEPLTGSYWGYRRKARLGVREAAQKGKVLVGFRERRGYRLADLHRCEVLDPRVGGLLEGLARLVESLSIPNRLPQIEVAAGDSSVALSFRVLAPLSHEDRTKLIAFGQHHNIAIYLQPKGPETAHLLWPEYSTLSYCLPAYGLELEFAPYHFIQVNAEINRKLVDRVITLLDVRQDETVLDLFCGLGNFTLALASQAGFVTGIEGDSSLVEWAKRNAEHNDVDNVRFFTADLNRDVADQPWMQHHYDKILLDPPRSGALEIIPHIATLQPKRIVYVSCHPATLARDAKELVQRFGYKLAAAGVIDMFPHTAHVECITLFER